MKSDVEEVNSAELEKVSQKLRDFGAMNLFGPQNRFFSFVERWCGQSH